MSASPAAPVPAPSASSAPSAGKPVPAPSPALAAAVPAPAFPRGEFRPRRSMVGYSRLCWIHEELKAGRPWTTPRLAQALGVTERTIRRDLRLLGIEFGQDVRFDVQRNTFFLASPGRELPHVPVTQGELFMLCLAQEALGAHADSAFGRTLQRAIGKQEAALNRRLDGRLAELMAAVCFRHIGGGAAPEALVFDTVAEAVGARRELWCDYRAQDRAKPIRRRVRPRCLVRLGATWYVMAHQTGSRRELTLALSRMSNLHLGDKTFGPEEGVTLREKLEQSIGIFGGEPQAVRVRLEGAAARVTEEQRLHPSQKIEPVGEGGAELSMEVAVNVELERWVLGWGEHAEVIAPPALRQKVAERLQKAAARYASVPETNSGPAEMDVVPREAEPTLPKAKAPAAEAPAAFGQGLSGVSDDLPMNTPLVAADEPTASPPGTLADAAVTRALDARNRPPRA